MENFKKYNNFFGVQKFCGRKMTGKNINGISYFYFLSNSNIFLFKIGGAEGI
jgi:hypothetical protein